MMRSLIQRAARVAPVPLRLHTARAAVPRARVVAAAPLARHSHAVRSFASESKLPAENEQPLEAQAGAQADAQAEAPAPAGFSLDLDDTSGIKESDFITDDSYLDTANPVKLTWEHYAEMVEILTLEDNERRGGMRPDTRTPEDMAIEKSIRAAIGMDPDTPLPPPPSAHEFLPDLGELDKEPEWTLDALRPKNKGRPNQSTCVFCRPETRNRKDYQLVYTNVNFLLKFVNERGMVMPRRFTKCCAKHQRSVAAVIKRSRSVGLLSYVSNWRVPVSFRPTPPPTETKPSPFYELPDEEDEMMPLDRQPVEPPPAPEGADALFPTPSEELKQFDDLSVPRELPVGTYRNTNQ